MYGSIPPPAERGRETRLRLTAAPPTTAGSVPPVEASPPPLRVQKHVLALTECRLRHRLISCVLVLPATLAHIHAARDAIAMDTSGGKMESALATQCSL